MGESLRVLLKESAAISIAGSAGGDMRSVRCCSACEGRCCSASAGGFIGTGGTLSTAGIDAQGDFTGAGAAGFATKVGFSVGVFKTSPPFG